MDVAEQGSGAQAPTQTALPRLSLAMAMVSLAIMALTYAVNAMDRIVFPTLLPNVARDYGLPLAAGGLLATIFTLGLGLAGIPGGLLFDRMSRKAISTLGIIIYSACTGLTCVAFGFYDMAIYRAVSGLGEGLQNAALFTLLGAYFVTNRTLAFGLMNVAYGIGIFIGPRLGASLMIGSGSWRTPLYLYAGLGVLATALMLVVPRRFTEQQAVKTRQGDAAEAHIPDRLLNRNTLLLASACVGGGLAGYGYLGIYPTFLRTELHFTIEQAAAAASMYGAGALMGVLGGYIADRSNQKILTILTLIALAAIGYAIFNIAVTPFWQDVLSFLQGTAQSGFLYLNNYSLMQRSVRARLAGRASGLVVTCVYLPAAVSGYLFAVLRNHYGWGNAALLQITAFLMIPTVLMLFFDLSRTSRARPAR
jgi:MFS family permease